MSLDTVIPPYIHRTCVKVGLHDAEAILNDPSAAVQFDDGRSRVMQIRTQGIEAVKAGFLIYHLLIERVVVYLCQFSIPGNVLRLDEALGQLRSLRLPRVRSPRQNR